MLFPFLPVEGGDDPGNASPLGVRSGTNTTQLFEPVSGDERLESLIAGAGILLLEVSGEQIYSMHNCDDAAVRNRAADMTSLVEGYRAEAAALDVSPGMAPAFELFIVALDEFAAAGALLGGGIRLARGVTIAWSYAFLTTGTHRVQYTAEPGELYLLVTVQVAHLGHRGGSSNTLIQTPDESAFLLHYAGETYRPLKVPGPTTRGGPYSKVRLDRLESMDGYLFFEVPDDLDPALAYLQVSVGGERPVWFLGGKL